jgi:hypothetical protein
VIRWRISPTPENEALLPPHLKPTDLQKCSPDRHPYIDHVYWSTLRDQLILKQNEYDMPSLIPELIRHTVRQDLEAFAAYPILDFQARLKYPDASRSTPLTDLLQLPVHNMMSNDPIQRMLLIREAQRYGFDRVEDWRIAPEFFTKYSNLNVPTRKFRKENMSEVLTLLVVCELPVVDFDTARIYFQNKN